VAANTVSNMQIAGMALVGGAHARAQRDERFRTSHL